MTPQYPSQFVYADFEFGNSIERYPALIWGSFMVDGEMHSFDLRSEGGQYHLREIINTEWKDRALVSYSLDAEIRALHSLYLKVYNPFHYGICLRRAVSYTHLTLPTTPYV